MSKKKFDKNLDMGVYIRLGVLLESNNDLLEEIDIEVDMLALISDALTAHLDGHKVRRLVSESLPELIDLEVISSYQVTNVKCLNGGEVVSDFL